MPELPEVETVRRNLEDTAVGKTVETVKVYWPNIIKRPDDHEAFSMMLGGKTIERVHRKGKFLVIYLEDLAVVSHLRMEGRYEWSDGGGPDKHTHVRFHFTDGTELRYRDVRKFGTMHVFNRGEEWNEKPLNQLGAEPYRDASFTADYLYARFQKTSRSIKAVLLDQSIIAGLGNIYVDEALFRAGVLPEAPAAGLEKPVIEILRKQIAEVIEEAVKQGGSTVRSYVNGDGQAGAFQLNLFVYGRKGEPCKVCSHEIERAVVAGRGTHYCPVCQTKEGTEWLSALQAE
ncbi:DNA-formamidopyrimidine glycosylase [Marinococcus luteus]|uniref:DNA-formamidopyrimidine glycosylase n=1 Tax=Marinococcus luteus TaxID=1122204 RepID=UPI002ACCF636|nr:DNA-formamidopyrimidine glycosylase [Marinococcus luteus]MDZ5783778.1 DNA-formamidopyrimidine glycosylase [Marinococcus luteus]